MIYSRALLPGIALAAAAGTASAQGSGCTEENGNWYCSQVDAISYSNFGTAGQYQQVTYMGSGGQCDFQPASYGGGMAPFDEEVSWHFRGPIQLKQFAFYSLGSDSSSSKTKRHQHPPRSQHFGRYAHRHFHPHKQVIPAHVAEKAKRDDGSNWTSWMKLWTGGSSSPGSDTEPVGGNDATPSGSGDGSGPSSNDGYSSRTWTETETVIDTVWVTATIDGQVQSWPKTYPGSGATSGFATSVISSAPSDTAAATSGLTTSVISSAASDTGAASSAFTTSTIPASSQATSIPATSVTSTSPFSTSSSEDTSDGGHSSSSTPLVPTTPSSSATSSAEAASSTTPNNLPSTSTTSSSYPTSPSSSATSSEEVTTSTTSDNLISTSTTSSSYPTIPSSSPSTSSSSNPTAPSTSTTTTSEIFSTSSTPSFPSSSSAPISSLSTSEPSIPTSSDSTTSSAATSTSSPSTGGGGGSGSWTRQAYYDAESGTASGLVFLNNFGGTGSGVFDYTWGNSLSYSNADATSGASGPTTLADTLVGDNQEFILMTDNPCTSENEAGCDYYRPGSVAYHGFGGASKLFLAEFQMPLSGKTGFNADMPATWMLNAQIPRTQQYGNCSCWTSGCGEFDILEVLNSGNTKCKSTWHGAHSLGDSNWFARPVDKTIKVAVILDGATSTGTASIVILDDGVSFDDSVDAASVSGWMSSLTSSESIETALPSK